MPNRLAIAEAADRLAVFDDIGDDVEFRHALDEPASGFLDGSKIEFAEAAAEGDQLSVGKLLAAKQQHRIIQPSEVDRGEMSSPNLRRSTPRISAPSPPPVGIT